ncbi:MAG: BPSL0067 family protein [Pseudomonadaceae bacterium]|nr:BPSL0067 family protein [Pseudomonadaceae bacterium]
MKPFVALLVCVLLLAVPELALAADSAGIGLSRRLICYSFSVLGGYVGLLIGFGAALYGLWTMIQGKFGWGLALIGGGALVTMAPPLVASSLSGVQSILNNTQISDTSNARDAYTIMMSMGAYAGGCDAGISVDMSSYAQDLTPSAAGNPVITQNPDGTYTVTGPDGSAFKVTSQADAQAIVDRGRPIGESTECVALTKALTDVGHTSQWTPGMPLAGNDIPVGTPIATFNCGGGSVYCNKSGSSHTGIYMGNGLMLHQWNGQSPIISRVPTNAGSYYVINKKA